MPAPDGQNLGGGAPLGGKGVDMGGGYQGLEAIFNRFEELVLALGIEFGQYII